MFPLQGCQVLLEQFQQSWFSSLYELASPVLVIGAAGFFVHFQHSLRHGFQFLPVAWQRGSGRFNAAQPVAGAREALFVSRVQPLRRQWQVPTLIAREVLLRQ
jgi:hypothetical protein